MTNLKDVSTEELEKELERRAKAPSPPPPILGPDFNEVRRIVIEGVACVSEYGTPPQDWKQYVWEAAMSAVYGPKVWEWYNKRVR